MMLGWTARSASVPPELDRCLVVHCCVEAVEGAVAPVPPPVVSPYLIVIVPPPFSVIPEMVIVRLETESEPVEAVE